jgi:acetyl esterase
MGWVFQLPRGWRIVLWIVCAIALLLVAAALAWRQSPWPSALVYRYAFDRGGVAINDALARHVPANIVSRLNERYDPADPDAILDVYLPASAETGGTPLAAIVWVHGGGFLSGNKAQVANYLKILAGRGYAVIGVGYSIAPGAKYPRPLQQLDRAFTFLQAEAKRLRIDPARMVIAGDSAGAQIAAQYANLVSEPAYAASAGIAPSLPRARLIGAILHCGIYDLALLKLDGGFGSFLRTAAWSYLGRRNFLADPKAAEFSVLRHVTAAFPPAFISAGNADPLLPHSLALADALAARGVRVERLFYPAEQTPPLGHEYQFVLETEAGRLALERTVQFLESLTQK